MKFHWGMKALIELHFQHEARWRFIENVLRSTLSYPNETSKECIKFLNIYMYISFLNLTLFIGFKRIEISSYNVL